MRRYRFSYQTIERYDSMVSNHTFQLRCTPYDAPFQRLEEHHLNLLSSVKVSRSEDVFGNIIHYGGLRAKHDLFVVSSSGVVACESYAISDPSPMQIYLHPTPLTTMNDDISSFDETFGAEGSALDVALRLSEGIYNFMKYVSGSTSVTTTAADSFRAGEGVCQDFSHLLIAMCRKRVIFARYVAGFVVGTGETHAWVEVWSDGVWYGIDPTHNLKVESGYIKVAHGRDAADCSVIRGMRVGVTNQVTQVRVFVEPI
ncbi:MAG: transglutaminase family protein [Rikenellaceae bacterium]